MRDRTTKIEWYRTYGVRECWLLDLSHRTVTVVDLQSDIRRSFTGEEPVQSTVLPEFRTEAGEFFE